MQNCAQLVAALFPPALNVKHNIEQAAKDFGDASVPEVIVQTPFVVEGWFPTPLKPVAPEATMFPSLEAGFEALLTELDTLQAEKGDKARIKLVLGTANRQVAGVLVFAPKTTSTDPEVIREAHAMGPYLSLMNVDPETTPCDNVRNLRGEGDWLFWISNAPELMVKTTQNEKTMIWAKNAPLKPTKIEK